MAIQITKILLKFKVTWRVIPNGVAIQHLKRSFFDKFRNKDRLCSHHVGNPIKLIFLTVADFLSQPFKRQFHKMVKHTQTICR